MKSKKQIIKEAMLRYFGAVEIVNADMLAEYACELAGLPNDPVLSKDYRNITRYLRELKNEGRLNYEYLGDGRYKNV